ncbi:LytTR family DNA-binding domain-containing protein [uncultured Tenacibaculum sp.]|uniref:LytR/AlgR family response regulator transcription factor n=1 Tax=uncultured Tenacibaculum sp. TaxID=174713 RepID=UPI0026300E60|nr:LytTR family DNA-binding domain-containing protein [uncultured Tenacibaculum sp.]
MEFKCIIVDDEQPARKLLENYCSKIKSLHVVGCYKSGLDALSVLQEKEIDILFLDIQMPDISGIDFLKSLKLHKTKVVFTTAYRDYALEGFELDAVDYLLKPIEFHRFLRAIEKVKEVHQKKEKREVKDVEGSLIIRSGKKQYRVPTSEILYIKSESEYVKYVTQNHGNLMVHGALKEVMNSLSNSNNFLRIHRSYIVNMTHITYVEGGRVRINGEFFPISETYRLDFLKTWK